MLKRLIYVLTALLVVFTMLVATIPVFALNTNSNTTVTGTIVAIDTPASTMTIRPLVGKFLKIKVAASTLVTRNGKSSSFSKLRVGDKTRLKYNTTTNQATNVDDTTGLYEIHGTVEAVNLAASRVTIASETGGNSVLVNVDASTVIKRNGLAATLASLVTGDKVEAKYNSANMLASQIKSEVEDRDFHGTIAALNFAANMVTITPKLGGADVVLKIVPSTVFFNSNLAVIAFTNLHVGDKVEAEHDSVTMIASKIKIDN